VILRLAALCACLALAGCDKDPPPPPNTPPPGGVEQITGNERLGWDQRASTAGELATFRYNIYVDGTPTQIQDLSCADVPAAAGFACSGRLPQMSPGQHTLALTAFIDAGTRLESARSATLTVNVGQGSSLPATSMTTVDGVRLIAFPVASGLDEPTDLAFAPDGRIFIAERRGRIRVVRDGTLQTEPAAMLDDVLATERRGLLAIALDPDYEKTAHIFAVYTALSGFRLARYRASGDTLGDRVILLDGIDAPLARPAASLRFGPDRKLYLGLDDAGDPVRPGDLGSLNGKVLRLNADATTPPDQASGTPVYALHVSSPRGIDWNAGGGTLWIVEDAAAGTERLQGVVSQTPTARRATPVVVYTLPAGTGPAGMAFYRGDLIPAFAGNLLIAAADGRSILRVRFDPADPHKIAATERLLGNAFGAVLAVAAGPDGVVYFCAGDTLLALVPDPTAPKPKPPV
jgi:glucose/arabinose dehydrogenase